MKRKSAKRSMGATDGTILVLVTSEPKNKRCETVQLYILVDGEDYLVDEQPCKPGGPGYLKDYMKFTNLKDGDYHLAVAECPNLGNWNMPKQRIIFYHCADPNNGSAADPKNAIVTSINSHSRKIQVNIARPDSDKFQRSI